MGLTEQWNLQEILLLSISCIDQRQTYWPVCYQQYPIKSVHDFVELYFVVVPVKWSWRICVKSSSTELQENMKSTNFVHISSNVPYIDGLVQDCSNSSANALELLQSSTKICRCIQPPHTTGSLHPLPSPSPWLPDNLSSCPWQPARSLPLQQDRGSISHMFNELIIEIL